MSSKSELGFRLLETENIIKWAISKIPSDRLLEHPPHGQHPHSDRGFKTYFGEWPALRHLFHLVHYEETYAIPAMQYYMGGPHPSGDLIFPQQRLEEISWQESVAHDVNATFLLRRLQELRDLQHQLLQLIPEEEWESEKIITGLGKVSAEFVVSKTVQHTIEHANELLKNALYWERALEWLDRQVTG
jgi:hypothetical protein